MYGALWRLLPGPLWLRLLLAAAAVTAVIALCVLVAFPTVDALLAPDETIRR